MVITKYKIHKLINSKIQKYLSLLNPFHPACHHLCLPHHGKDHKTRLGAFRNQNPLEKFIFVVGPNRLKAYVTCQGIKLWCTKESYFFAGEKEQQLTAAVDCLTDQPTSAESVRLHHFAENFSSNGRTKQPTNPLLGWE